MKKEKDVKKEPKTKTAGKKKGKDVLPSNSTPPIQEDAKSESSFGSHSYDQASISPPVDAEGYIIRPSGSEEKKSRSDSYEQYKSDSDSDSGKPNFLFDCIGMAQFS